MASVAQSLAGAGGGGAVNTTGLDYRAAAALSSGSQPKQHDVEVNWNDVPDKYFIIIANFLAGRINDTKVIDQFNGPLLKASLDSVYWIFLVQYAALSMLGIATNLAIIGYIMYHRLFKDVTHAFIVNLALCHFVQCAVVLPLTLMVMLLQNWVFGQFLCFFLPIMQDIPLHVAMLSHILIAWDRMRWLGDPLKGRLPAFVCCCATWLTGMVIALPYPIYMIYVEIGDFVPSLAGVGLCVVNLMDDMHEYMRCLFFIMYCAPTVLLAYLYIKTSQELRPPDGPFAVMMFEHRAGLRNRQHRHSSTSSVDRSTNAANTATTTTTTTTATSGLGSSPLTTITTHGSGGPSQTSTAAHASSTTSGGMAASATTTTGMASAKSSRSYDLYSAELDVCREKRKQRNFGSMAAAQVVCLCPLMVLRFARLSLEETYENQRHIDFTYLMFVWIAFLPTVIFPLIYGSQILPRTEQERLRGYFRLSTKRLHKSRSGLGGSGAGRLDSGRTPSSRGDSIEKDDNTNTTLATSIIASGEDYLGGEATVAAAAAARAETAGDAGASHHYHNRDTKRSGAKHHQTYRGHAGHQPHRQGKDVHGAAAAGSRHYGKEGGRNVRKNDVKINIISDGHSRGGGGVSKRQAKSSSANLSGPRGSIYDASLAPVAYAPHPHQHQRKLTLESLENNSCSNLTSSTYCNGNGSSLLDDGGMSNFGDGEDSSIVSGMIVQGGGGGGRTSSAPYFDKKWSLGGRGKDVSFSDCDSFSRMDSSSSTLERDLEIIDMLERERSMNIQEMIEREQHGEQVRLYGERRRLPDIEKIYQRSPKSMLDPYAFDHSCDRSASSSSTVTAKDSHGPLSSATSIVASGSDPLQSGGEAYSAASTLVHDDQTAGIVLEDEEVPQDFFDSYMPGSEANMPPTGVSPMTPAAVAPYQYQYTRRLSRKSSHHSQSSSSHHRGSKRDSFNSLNGTDLIAGAFGELDPTQPLTKMSVIENRMRRSSGRNTSFSSSARSSTKSRDYNHGSTNSGHPELDFRENIFAEL